MPGHAAGHGPAQPAKGAENSIHGGKRPGLTVSPGAGNNNSQTTKWLYRGANRLIVYYTNHIQVQLN